jgi:dephospho-CoA kinase
MTTDPTNLTVDDWRNISQGFGLLTGGVAAGTRKVKKSMAEADMKAKANGAVAIEMVDKNNPANKKIVAFDGNDAVAIKKA